MSLGSKMGRSALKVNDVRVKNKGATLALIFDHHRPVGRQVTYSAELLRVIAPSTDVASHDTLVYGKKGLRITDMYPVGNYAFRITFSDDHDAGIFTYEYLDEISSKKWEVMREYLKRLRQNNKRRAIATTKKLK